MKEKTGMIIIADCIWAYLRRKSGSYLESYTRGASQDLEGACRQFFYGFVNAQRQYFGEPNWMDTSPPNIMYASSIYRLLPDAKFIQMQRNPLDTIASVISEPGDQITLMPRWHGGYGARR